MIGCHGRYFLSEPLGLVKVDQSISSNEGEEVVERGPHTHIAKVEMTMRWDKRE